MKSMVIALRRDRLSFNENCH